MRLSESEIQGLLCAVRHDAYNSGCSPVPSHYAVKNFDKENTGEMGDWSAIQV